MATTLMQVITDFVITLPPLLQLLLVVFVTLGFFRCFIAVVDFIEDRRGGKIAKMVQKKLACIFKP